MERLRAAGVHRRAPRLFGPPSSPFRALRLALAPPPRPPHERQAWLVLAHRHVPAAGPVRGMASAGRLWRRQ